MKQATDTAFEEFVHVARGAVETIRHGFTRPDDDWSPVILVQHDRGGASEVILVPSFFFGTDAMRDILASEIAALARAAVRIAFVSSAWTMSIPAPRDGSRPSIEDVPLPRESPDRTECVSLIAAEPGRVESWSVPIGRTDADPPTLGNWRLAPDSVGRFADALRGAWS